MNINQIGLYSQNSDKSNKVSSQVQSTGEAMKSSHIKVGQSSIQNALATSNSTYGKSVSDNKTICQEEIAEKSAAESFEDVKNRMTEEDAKDMEEEGMSLEKYNMERLERTLNRIKGQRQQKRQAIEGNAEKREQQAEDMERAVIHAATQGMNSSQIAQALESANLPITEENVTRIAKACNMAQAAGNISDEGIAYMVANELDATIMNFYQAEHVGKSMAATTQFNNVGIYESVNVAYDISNASQSVQGNQADWEKLKDQVVQVVEQAGLEATDEVMEQCQWLFDKDLPITEDSIKSVLEIQDIKENFNQNELISNIIDSYETGVDPEDTDLGFFSKKESSVDLETFLKQVEQRLSDHDLQIQDVTFHRQLEEIRLKMTSEVTQKLEEMGIQIDMDHISDIIRGLKEMEDSYYKGLFAEAGIDAVDEQVALLKETTEKANSLASMPDAVLGKTYHTRMTETLDTLVEAGNELKSQLERAGEAYETLGTEIRKDLGDSINKAFQNINDILDDLGLEPTEANVRAVKILGYNSIAITEESVLEMKNYDSKVQELIDGLKPAVTMEMIKSGMNPLDTPIDEVNQAIEDIQKEIGTSGEEKYSEFLWKLDKKDALTADERKAYIGMYRMLTQIEKSDGAAIGSVIKAGKELTLDNLLTAVKTIKSGGVDTSIDEAFGGLEEVDRDGETIQEQVSYYRRLSRNILDKLEPQHLEPHVENGDVSLEQLSEKVQEDDGSEHLEYLRERQKQYNEMIKNPEECTAFLENNNQDVTLETMMAAEQILSNKGWDDAFKKMGRKDKEALAKEAEELVEQMDDDMFDADFLQFTNNVQAATQKEYENDTNSYVDVSLLKLVGSSLQLTGSLSRQGNYNIPMMFGDNVGNVNVTVKHKDAAGGKVEISYESDKLGKVQAQLTVKNGEIKGFITTDNQPGLQLIRSEKDAMTNGFEALGLDVKQVDYSIFSSRNMSSTAAENGGEGISTQELLKTAKVFIGTLSTIERREG